MPENGAGYVYAANGVSKTPYILYNVRPRTLYYR